MQETAEAKSEPDASPRLGGIEALRLIGFLMVFATHAYGHAEMPAAVVSVGGIALDLEPMIWFGQKGVTLFFVLSGFLLSRGVWRNLEGPPASAAAFYARRFLRIYPAYFVAVWVYALFHDVHHPLWMRAVHVVTHLGLIHNLAERTIYNPSVPLWYIATAAQLYLLMPLIFWAMREAYKRGASGLAISLGVVISAAAVGALWDWAATMLVVRVAPDPRLVAADGNVIYAFPLSHLPSVGMGIGLACFAQALDQRHRAGVRRMAPGLVAVAVISLVACAYRTPELFGMASQDWPVVDASFALLILGVSALPKTHWLSKSLGSAALRWGGAISYSLYLFHDLALWTVFNRLPTGWIPAWCSENGALAAVALLLTCGLGWLSYQLLERRLMGMVRRVLVGRGWLPE